MIWMAVQVTTSGGRNILWRPPAQLVSWWILTVHCTHASSKIPVHIKQFSTKNDYRTKIWPSADVEMSKCKSNVRMQSLPLGWSRYPWRQAQRTPSALLWQWCAQPISSSHRELAVSSTTDRLHRANTRLCLHLQHMRQNCIFFRNKL